MFYYLTALLLILARITIDPELVKFRGALRWSWKLVASITLVQAFAAFLPSEEIRFSSGGPGMDNFLAATTWFLLFCSTIALLNAILPSDELLRRRDHDDELRRRHNVTQPDAK